MAYSTSNPPSLTTQAIAGPSLWTYASTDVSTDVDAADYFSNGKALGMKVGDIVHVVETDNSYLLTIHSVTAVGTAAATVSAAI